MNFVNNEIVFSFGINEDVDMRENEEVVDIFGQEVYVVPSFAKVKLLAIEIAVHQMGDFVEGVHLEALLTKSSMMKSSRD